jgi:photosystem II stability/assembly factor-like uncharacterized protein
MKKLLLLFLILPQFLLSQTLYSTRLDSNDFYAVYFQSSFFGFIMGENGTLLRTENGGMDWNPVTAEIMDSVGIRDMVFLNDTLGFAVGDKATLLSTTDRGSSWQQVAIDEGGPLGPDFGAIRAISFFNEQIGWLAGDNGEAQLTTDGGSSWMRKETGHPESISGIISLSDTSAMAVLINGLLLYTEDMGEVWMDARVFEDTLGESPAIYSLFEGDNNAWVAGAPGRNPYPYISFIDEISNNWMNWQAISSPVVAVDSANPHYTDIHFTAPDTGWVIGWDKLILFTHNGGQSWTQLPSPDSLTNELNGLFLTPDTNAVWIVGNDGLVISTQPFPLPPMAIEPEIQSNFILYPNPNSGQFFIQNPFDRPKEALLYVYDMQGKLVFEKPLSFSASKRQIVDLQGIQQGIYVAQLVAEGEVFTPRKLVVGF